MMSNNHTHVLDPRTPSDHQFLLDNQLPQTPGSPIDSYPWRPVRSPFQIHDSSQSGENAVDGEDASSEAPVVSNFRSNIGRKRAIPMQFGVMGSIVDHTQKTEKAIHLAEANQHRDMRLVPSAGGSIDASFPPPRSIQTLDQELLQTLPSTEPSWRYSMYPQALSDTKLDVHKTLTNQYLPLPDKISTPGSAYLTSLEPPSSGFGTCPEVEWVADCTEPICPRTTPLSASSQYVSDNRTISGTHVSTEQTSTPSNLEQPVPELPYSSDKSSDAEQLLDSPIVEHLKRLSGNTYNSMQYLEASTDSIFLSQSAKAAAEYAKAKRGFTTQASCGRHTEPLGNLNRKKEVVAQQTSRVQDSYPALQSDSSTQPKLRPVRRITASGSPILVPGRASIPETNHSSEALTQDTTPSPSYLHPDLQGVSQIGAFPRPTRRQSEYFQPGWHYTKDSKITGHRPDIDFYSFSTAAAKATGESVTPESRIRDSYRTDTLTLLAKLPGRHNKIGLLGESYRSPRYRYQSNPRSLPRPARRRPAPLGNTTHGPSMRANENSYSALPQPHSTQSNSEDFPAKSQAIKQLSPNVDVWRKGVYGDPRMNKKRRPSYWDDDLEEVRQSPARRTGLASSPISYQYDVVKEPEDDVCSHETLDIDENDLVGEVERAGEEFEQRLTHEEHKWRITTTKLS